MTDQLMFDTWVGLLRPLFPLDAEFTFRPRRRLICVVWPNGNAPPVVVAFTQLAWKTYRGARSARRARADTNLFALVQTALTQAGGVEAADDFPGGELRIEVASIDLLPPPSASGQPQGQSISAG